MGNISYQLALELFALEFLLHCTVDFFFDKVKILAVCTDTGNRKLVRNAVAHDTLCDSFAFFLNVVKVDCNHGKNGDDNKPCYSPHDDECEQDIIGTDGICFKESEICDSDKNSGFNEEEEAWEIQDPVLEPFWEFEVGGKKIAIIGITTPESFTKSTPAYFQNENGEYIYGIGGSSMSGLAQMLHDKGYDVTGSDKTHSHAVELLKEMGMQVFIGTVTSGACIAVAAETSVDRVFTLTPSASSSDVTAGKDNVFQVCFSDPNQGSGSAIYIANNMPGAKIAIIYRNDDAYSQGIRDTFAAEAAKQGLASVSELTGGNSLASNIQLAYHNARCASRIAVEYSKL